MKNGNFEMDDEEYMEALDLRDEYRYAHKLNHNIAWWDELEELTKKRKCRGIYRLLDSKWR